MKTVGGLGLAVGVAMISVLPARVEADPLTFRSCQQDASGLCQSLPLSTDVPKESGYLDSTFATDPGQDSSMTVDVLRGKASSAGGDITFADIVGALKSSGDPGIRIASHVRGSESGVMTTISLAALATPEPASISLFGLVLLAAAYEVRRRRTALIGRATVQIAPARSTSIPKD